VFLCARRNFRISRSVGIVRSRTQTMEFSLVLVLVVIAYIQKRTHILQEQIVTQGVYTEKL
jgi:uncharacterized protein (UPF0333 family)